MSSGKFEFSTPKLWAFYIFRPWLTAFIAILFLFTQIIYPVDLVGLGDLLIFYYIIEVKKRNTNVFLTCLTCYLISWPYPLATKPFILNTFHSHEVMSLTQFITSSEWKLFIFEKNEDKRFRNLADKFNLKHVWEEVFNLLTNIKNYYNSDWRSKV